LEARVVHIQGERARERAAWEKASEAAVDTARKQVEEEMKERLARADAEHAAQLEQLSVDKLAQVAEERRALQAEIAALKKRTDEQAAELRAGAERMKRLDTSLNETRQEATSLKERTEELEQHVEAQENAIGDLVVTARRKSPHAAEAEEAEELTQARESVAALEHAMSAVALALGYTAALPPATVQSETVSERHEQIDRERVVGT
jgi:chromosome segregation ATPase